MLSSLGYNTTTTTTAAAAAGGAGAGNCLGQPVSQAHCCYHGYRSAGCRGRCQITKHRTAD